MNFVSNGNGLAYGDQGSSGPAQILSNQQPMDMMKPPADGVLFMPVESVVAPDTKRLAKPSQHIQQPKREPAAPVAARAPMPSSSAAPAGLEGAVAASAPLAPAAPMLPFHNPFDTHSYPLTNPPIFDYTMKFPYTGTDGAPRRRRISISNGQIGQIINHEAFFDYDSPIDDFGIDAQQQHIQRQQHHQLQHHQLHQEHRQHLQQQQEQQHLQQQQQQQQQQHLQQQQQQQHLQQQQQQQQQHLLPPPPPPPLSLQVAAELAMPATVDAEAITPSSSEFLVLAAGVPPPDHQLLYDNEVIYNPHDGPIPGTAAWKKERLLERNRIAASRCRQRKKHAQLLLQDNILKYQLEVNALQEKVEKYREVVKRYNAAVLQHLHDCKNFDSLSLLKVLEEMDMDKEEQQKLGMK